MSFVLGFAAQRAASPFGISMLGVGRAAPAQFPATGREFTRHPARGPEGPLGGISANKAYAENIDFNRPFQKERHAFRPVFLFEFRRLEAAPLSGDSSVQAKQIRPAPRGCLR